MKNIFGSITYSKRSAILKMISKVMGEEKFDHGIRNYLKKYACQNVEQDDLFSELDKVITADQLGPDGKQLNITHFGYQWTLQMGFPLVTIKRANSTHCEVSQRRFVEDGGEEEEDPRYADNAYGYKWDDPLWIERSVIPTSEFKRLPANTNLFIPCGKEVISLNAHSNGFFVSDKFKE